MLGVLVVLLGPATPVPENQLERRDRTATITLDMSSNWAFHLGDVPEATSTELVTPSGWVSINLPHTWNALDAQDGAAATIGTDYFRGVGWYRKTVAVPGNLRDRTLFVEFGGASSVADVYVNGVLVGHRENPFMPFRVDVTDELGDGGIIAVRVDNSARPNVAPLTGDFPVFGGLYRGVGLIATGVTHLDRLDASSGVIVRQQQLTVTRATVQVSSAVVNAEDADVLTRIIDRAGRVVAQSRAAAGRSVIQTLDVPNPRPWNGTTDPYLYAVDVAVVVDGSVVDEVRQPLGLRTIAVDPERGLLLNGRPYKIRGVNRHQDRLNEGWATSSAQIVQDIALMREMGANALRTAHYPQDELVYDLADRYGILVYTEVPFVGATAVGAGSNPSRLLTENLVSQARDMVRGLGNHPSIIWWGIGNEQSDRPDVRANLDAIERTIKAEDPTRLTAYAQEASADDANLRSNLLLHADLSAYNEYSGWYYAELHRFGARLDRLHLAERARRIGVTEFGAGASIYQHTEWPGAPGGSAQRPVAHPEEYQAYYHSQLWAQIQARPWLWGTFVWNMFDFASDSRNEGDRPGINDKGLVTYDRRVRKDAFYYYKSAWTETPTVHIVSKRWSNRRAGKTTIRVFSNASAVTLDLNGTTRTRSVVNYTAEFPATLRPGINSVIVSATKDSHQVRDVAAWTLRPTE